MKKALWIPIFALVVAVVILPASVLATRSNTDVTGYVTDNGQAVNKADVRVTCQGDTKHTKTDSSGAYLVVFPAQKCPDGSVVTVSASEGGVSGTTSGTVLRETTRLNVAVINVSVPELGWLTGIAAAVIGGAAFLVIRRRQLS